MPLHRYFLALICLLISQVTYANTPPKIGLVLSGGGAKGSAHIGVLKVLEQHNIAVDYITGTSIGAYVGGMYALGYSVEEIEKRMLTLDWDAGYSDTIPRESLHYEEKQRKDQYNIPLKFGYSEEELKTTSGFLVGQTVAQLLKESTDLVAEFDSFDNLAIPYRAVATDLVTSLAVVLDSGSIVDAMRASAAVPGAVQPIDINGMMLVDGGLANNMPIDVVKAMGADIVIAVDIGSSLSSKDQIKMTIDVLNQLSTFLTNATSEAQKKLLQPGDILIRPDVGQLSTTDWSILPQALVLGEQAALLHSKQLQALSLSDEAFAQYQAKKKQRSLKWFSPIEKPITAIHFANQSKVNNTIIKNSFAVEVGQVLNQQALKAAIDRVYALDKFEYVDAEFTDDENGRVLTLITRAKSWGPNYINVGFSMQDNFSQDTTVLLDFSYVLTDITINGGSWRNDLTIGYEKKFATEFYQPLDIEHSFFSRARLQFYQHDWGGENQEGLSDELVKRSLEASMSLGYNIFDNGIAELGLIAEKGNISYKNWTDDEADFASYGFFFHLGYDNLNSINFPTSGNQLSFDLRLGNDQYDQFYFDANTDKSIKYDINWRGAISLEHHTLVGIASYAKVNSENNYTVHVSELGGFLNLSAYQRNELVGAHKLFGALVYHYDLGRDTLGLTDFPLYLGTSLEAGNVWTLAEHINVDDVIYSSSLFLGTDTSMGPVALGFGYAEKGQNSFFLSIGKSW